MSECVGQLATSSGHTLDVDDSDGKVAREPAESTMLDAHRTTEKAVAASILLS